LLLSGVKEIINALQCDVSTALLDRMMDEVRTRPIVERWCDCGTRSWAGGLEIFGIRIGNAQGIGHIAGVAASTSACR
jgi:hypothetical protein